MPTSQGWRWSNVPVPEPHVAGLLVGALLHRIDPRPITGRPGAVRTVGWPLLLVGVVTTAWAVRTTREVDVADPSTLVTAGPYAHSRNPM